jgi:hypothetical protein
MRIHVLTLVTSFAGVSRFVIASAARPYWEYDPHSGTTVAMLTTCLDLLRTSCLLFMGRGYS